jgi:peptidoglycan/LPS O-acetylase OafA/YrhL
MSIFSQVPNLRETTDEFFTNNFDLIRIVAALEDALIHCFDRYNLYESYGSKYQIVRYIPGVPIFFFTSGFLISKSFEKSPSLCSFAWNRALRIFPALVVCTLISIISVYLSGYRGIYDSSLMHLIIWALGQMTIVQFYNPEFMRGYGTGVLNGSLWTITVELQFYFLTPIIYSLITSTIYQKKKLILPLLTLLFLLISVSYNHLRPSFSDALWFKILGITFAPWLYMFLTGIIFQKHFDTIFKYCSIASKGVLIIIVLLTILASQLMDWNYGNFINPIMFMVSALVTFVFAYSKLPTLPRFFGSPDLSYGLYIYHAPIINWFIFCYNSDKSSTLFDILAVLSCALIAAFFSWFCVEKSALSYKTRTIRDLTQIP